RSCRGRAAEAPLLRTIFFSSALSLRLPRAVLAWKGEERRKDLPMNERDLFMAALQIEDAAERFAYLDRACAGETALRQRVEALLAAFEQAGSFLQQPARGPRTTSDGSH